MNKNFIFLYSLVAVLLLIVGILGGYILFKERGGQTAVSSMVAPAGHVAGPEVPPRGLELAKGWKCMCGACADDLLVCHCDDPNGAHEIKKAISDGIAAGKSDQTLREELVKKYGVALLGAGQPAAVQGGVPAGAAVGGEN